MTEQENIAWWQRMGKRLGWPNWGHWLIAPDDDPDAQEDEPEGAWMLLHGETMTRIPFTVDQGNTLEDEEVFFGKVFPGAQVKAPTAMSHPPNVTDEGRGLPRPSQSDCSQL
jgi:hypothetical protein